jgi:hypothetical protein
MPAYYKITKEQRLVITTVFGVVTLADGLAHQEKLLNDPDFDPSFSQLMDFTQVAKFEIAAKEVRTLAQRSVFSPESRRAILVNGDLAFGLARMFEVHRENVGEKGIRVFWDLDAALAWVLGKSTSA